MHILFKLSVSYLWVQPPYIISKDYTIYLLANHKIKGSMRVVFKYL